MADICVPRPISATAIYASLKTDKGRAAFAFLMAIVVDNSLAMSPMMWAYWSGNKDAILSPPIQIKQNDGTLKRLNNFRAKDLDTVVQRLRQELVRAGKSGKSIIIDANQKHDRQEYQWNNQRGSKGIFIPVPENF